MARIAPKSFQTKSLLPFLVRTIEPSEAKTIIAFAKRSMSEEEFTLTSADEFNVTEEQEAAWIRDHLAHPSQLLLAAELSGEVVGMLNFSIGHRRKVAHTGEFGMSVALERREDGIGGALLSVLVEWAVGAPGVEKIYLRVHSTNARAIRLYEKHGFAAEGRLSRDIKFRDGRYADTLMMSRFVK